MKWTPCLNKVSWTHCLDYCLKQNTYIMLQNQPTRTHAVTTCNPAVRTPTRTPYHMYVLKSKKCINFPHLFLVIISRFGTKYHRQCSYERSKSWTNVEEEQDASKYRREEGNWFLEHRLLQPRANNLTLNEIPIRVLHQDGLICQLKRRTLSSK